MRWAERGKDWANVGTSQCLRAYGSLLSAPVVNLMISALWKVQGWGRKREGVSEPERLYCVQGGKIVENKWKQQNTIGWFVFSGKAKSVDNKRDPIPINMNQHGEQNMFRTMIPWLRVCMGLWCNKICINNIKWRFKTISFCDPRPFKASWCKLITSSRISVPLWFFLTQIDSEIYFGLCHMSFLHIFISLLLIRAWSF